MANIFLVVVFLMAAADAVPLTKKSEGEFLEKKILESRREVLSTIRNYLNVLQQRKFEEEDDQTSERNSEQSRKSVESQDKMLERRKKLIESIRHNNGFQILIRSLLEKQRKEEQESTASNDAEPRRCRPGIFFCRRPQHDSKWIVERPEIKGNRKNTLIADAPRCHPGIFYCRKSDEGATNGRQSRANKRDPQNTKSADQNDPKSRRCRPGVFYCPQGDEAKGTTVERNAIAKLEDIIEAGGYTRTDSKEIARGVAKRGRCRPGVFYCPQRDEDRSETAQSKAPEKSKAHTDKRVEDLLRSLDTSQTADQASKHAQQRPLTKIDDDADWLTKLFESTRR